MSPSGSSMSCGYILICLALLCITCSLCQDAPSTDSGKDLRNFVGLNPETSDARSNRRAVIILSGHNLSGDATHRSTNEVRKSDLIGVAMDMEDRDPNSLYVHFDGDTLISSQPVLFNDLENSQASAGDKWTGVMDGIKAHRSSENTPLADLLIFEAYPESFPQQVTALCESLYSTGNCQIVQGQVASENEARFRRAADDKDKDEENEVEDEPPGFDPTRVLPKIPYSAGFQLLFWTTLAIFLTVYGVSWAMWNMDPGRDSIIYRMTSAQKYKKDK
ncbi:uncharacterized protein LOC129588097 [Paramacrobiotus metropolitanus]|uniref:uncharacterized protein LOC129588097 n=1 Tax=Paramacrobiotus metropolitanus TaxID=2943436 RepID=UPI002445B522|nr:uncharacterized protein LOC129588097 [Paramacrobiotus metropolitanus]